MIHLDWSYDEIILHLNKDIIMPDTYGQSELREELRNAPAEPLLPIEKKLIAWSLGIGIALLIVLAAVNHLYPPGG